MFDNFSKVNYYINGQTLEVVDIFKSVKLDFSNFLNYTTRKNDKGLRPDQFSNELYADPKKFWTILLTNDIKNPFKEWSQGQSTLEKQNEAEYDSYVFQFANNSKYLPGNTLYYETNATDSYLGISLGNIKENDIIVYSLGNNSDKLTTFGAGQITSGETCGFPHFGQALIPPNFTRRNLTESVSAEGNITACLSGGKIFVWGQPIGLDSGMIKNDRLYTDNGTWTNVYSFKNKVIAASTDVFFYKCFGNGCTAGFDSALTGFNVVKMAFTKTDAFSGVAATSGSGTFFYGGLTQTQDFIEYSDVACTDSYCIGVVADSGSEGLLEEINQTGTASGILATITPPLGSLKVTKIACGVSHCLFIDENGGLHTLGTNEKGRLDLPLNKTYTQIGAGEYFSAAIDSDSNLVVAGEILTNSGSCSGVTAYVPITSIEGKYDKLACGDNHIVCLGSGTSKQYLGRITRVDDEYKRIFVKSYTAPTLDTVNITDPGGANITVFRDRSLVKNIQHQLFSIDSYLNTTQYVIDSNNTVVNITENNGSSWKTDFIINYKNAPNLPLYITPHKIKIEKINTDIKLVNLEKLYILEKLLSEQLKTENKIYIKLSDL